MSHIKNILLQLQQDRAIDKDFQKALDFEEKVLKPLDVITKAAYPKWLIDGDDSQFDDLYQSGRLR